MAKKLQPIEGLDYVPIPGDDPNLGFGVIRRQLAGVSYTAGQAVLRRLIPVGEKPAGDERWEPTCYRADVLLPPGIPDHLCNLKVLCELYEEQAFDGIKDLIVIATLRFPEATSLHEIFEDVRGFAREVAIEKSVAVILAFHVPALAGQSGPPHIHMLIPARRLEPFGFGEFLRPLSTDKGREIIEAKWAEWSSAKDAGSGGKR